MKLLKINFDLVNIKLPICSYIEKINIKLKNQSVYEGILNLSFNNRIDVTHFSANNIGTEFGFYYDKQSYSSNIDLNFVINNLQIKWNWSFISLQQKFDWNIVKDNKYAGWEYGILSWNYYLDLNFLKENPDFIWEWKILSVRSDISLRYILENYKFNWDWDLVCKHRILTDLEISYMLEHNIPINWKILSCREKYFVYKMGGIENKYKFICRYSEDNSNYERFKLVNKYKHCDWDWRELSYAKDISENKLKFILNNPELDWDWREVGIEELSYSNRNIMEDIIRTFPDKKWDWHNLSKSNNYLTLSFLKEHLDKNLCWPTICYEGKFNLKYILENPQLKWCWNQISYNHRCFKISIDEIKKNKKLPWNWNLLIIQNPEEEEFKKIRAVRMIELYVLERMYNPKYKFCRDIQWQRFTDLFSSE